MNDYKPTSRKVLRQLLGKIHTMGQDKIHKKATESSILLSIKFKNSSRDSLLQCRVSLGKSGKWSQWENPGSSWLWRIAYSDFAIGGPNRWTWRHFRKPRAGSYDEDGFMGSNRAHSVVFPVPSLVESIGHQYSLWSACISVSLPSNLTLCKWEADSSEKDTRWTQTLIWRLEFEPRVATLRRCALCT